MHTRSEAIGLLLDWLDPSYAGQVLRGAQAATRERDVSLICYTSGLPGPQGDAEWPAHEIIGREAIDGLIILGDGRVPEDDGRRGAFPDVFRSLPRCLVAGEQPQASSVSIDNEAAIAKPVEHLVKAHGCRRIAYIGGPDGRPDARVRVAGFCRALAAYELEVDPQLILPGEFTVRSGRRAAQILLDERRVPIKAVDAIVAANDGMAWGCIEALAAHGISVPWEVAVTGFDDVAAGRQARVPLTTVHQPVAQAGGEAAELVLSQIAGGPPQRVWLDTELVVRRSCGCLEGIGRLPLTPAELQQRGGRSFEAAFVQRRGALIDDVRRAGRNQLGMLGSGWETRLVTGLVEEIRGRSSDAFRLALDDALGRVVAADGDTRVFHDVTSQLWRHLIPCVLADQGLRTALEGVLDGARLAIAAAGVRAQAAEQMETEARARELVRLCIAVSASASAEDLAGVVEDRFASVGISTVSVALFPDGQIGESVQCVLSLQDGTARLERFEVPTRRFAARLIPATGRANLIVSGLGIAPSPFGLVCMGLEPASQLVHNGVRDALSRACARLRPELWREGD